MGLVTLIAVREGVRTTLVSEIDTMLRADLREVALSIKELGFPASQELLEGIDRKARGHAPHGWYLRLMDANKQQIWASFNAPPKGQLPENLVDFTPITFEGNRVVQYHDRDPQHPERATFIVRVGLSLQFITQDMAKIDQWVFFAGAGVLFASPVCGYVLARAAVRPLANMMRTAERLRPQELDERLPIRGVDDELDQLSRTINRLLDRIGQFLEQRKDFLANAAHELRSPLAAIRSSIEVALNGDPATTDYSELLDELLDECRALETLINQLLLLSETDADRLKTHRETVPLHEVARRAAEMFAGVAEFRGQTLHWNEVEPANVVGNRHHLRQVLNNLLDNAIKFNPNAGEVRLALRVDQARERAILSVTDTGRGIPPEDLPHVFERFFRGDKARHREGPMGGTGLGLSICQAVIEAHGGRISIESTVGQGTVVTVELPLAGPTPDADRPVAAKLNEPRHGN